MMTVEVMRIVFDFAWEKEVWIGFGGMVEEVALKKSKLMVVWKLDEMV